MIKTKNDWLVARTRILSGQLTDQDMPQLYAMFNENCVAAYKTADMQSFQDAFINWFNNPLTRDRNTGMPHFNQQKGIVGRFIAYFDARFHVTYLFDKLGKIIKVY